MLVSFLSHLDTWNKKHWHQHHHQHPASRCSHVLPCNPHKIQGGIDLGLKHSGSPFSQLFDVIHTFIYKYFLKNSSLILSNELLYWYNNIKQEYWKADVDSMLYQSIKHSFSMFVSKNIFIKCAKWQNVNYIMTVWILVGNVINLSIAVGLIRLHMPSIK